MRRAFEAVEQRIGDDHAPDVGAVRLGGRRACLRCPARLVEVWLVVEDHRLDRDEDLEER
jgi:hypothetical protein